MTPLDKRKLDEVHEICIEMRATLKSVCEKVSEHEGTLHGDGNQPGLVVQVDRLNEGEKRRGKVLGGIIAATTALGVKFFSDLFQHH